MPKSSQSSDVPVPTDRGFAPNTLRHGHNGATHFAKLNGSGELLAGAGADNAGGAVLKRVRNAVATEDSKLERDKADKALLLGCVSGSNAAFSAFYARLSRPLFSMVYEILKHRKDTEDVLQEVRGKGYKITDCNKRDAARARDVEVFNSFSPGAPNRAAELLQS